MSNGLAPLAALAPLAPRTLCSPKLYVSICYYMLLYVIICYSKLLFYGSTCLTSMTLPIRQRLSASPAYSDYYSGTTLRGGASEPEPDTSSRECSPPPSPVSGPSPLSSPQASPHTRRVQGIKARVRAIGSASLGMPRPHCNLVLTSDTVFDRSPEPVGHAHASTGPAAGQAQVTSAVESPEPAGHAPASTGHAAGQAQVTN